MKTNEVNQKQSLIIEYLQGSISFGQLGKKHGVSKATAHKWVKAYIEQSKELNTQSPEIVKENTSYFGKMSRIEAELYEANTRLKLLQEAISIAEKDFGINILKKSGAKQ